jgi:ferredoxin
MKTTLYYFSGTGNSYVVARDIGALLGDAELVPVTRALRNGVRGQSDNIGIVFPVYMWGMPLVVVEFCKKLKPVDAKYFFAVCTCGGFQGGTLQQADELLKNNGIKLSAGFSIKMPGNYTPMYGAISAIKQQKMFAEEKEKVKAIVERVRALKNLPVEKNNFILNYIVSVIFYKFSAPHIPEMDKKFYADSKCTGCGLCASICPAKNIVIKEKMPAWQHKCYQCFACLQWCPEEAIQYGESTKDRKRYRHPDVKVDDFLIE